MRAKRVFEFHKGNDPIKSLGLGTEALINKYFEETYGDSVDETDWIYEIVHSRTLSDKEIKAFVEHLVSKGRKEFLDEETWWQIQDKGCDVLGAVPVGFSQRVSGHNSLRDPYLNDMTLKKIAQDSFEVKFVGWEDFANFIKSYQNVDINAIRAILSGDAFEYFYYDYTPDDKTIKHFVLRNESSMPCMNTLKDMYSKLIGKENFTTEEMLEDMFTNEEYEHTFKQALESAASETESIADEDEAYKDIKGQIIKDYGLSDIRYDDLNEIYVAKITKHGAEKMMSNWLIGEDPIEYYSRGDYNGDWLPDVFNDALSDKLDHLNYEF